MNGRRWLGALLALTMMGCASEEAPAEEAEAETSAGGESTEGPMRVATVAPDSCGATVVEEGVVRVDATPFNWSFFLGAEPEVDCEEPRVVVSMGPGFKVVFVAIDPARSDASAETMGRVLVDGVTHAMTGTEPTEAQELITIGERARPGICREVDHEIEDLELRTATCAVWQADPNGLEHIGVVTLTNTRQEWSQMAGDSLHLAGRVFDLWVVADQAEAEPSTEASPEAAN